MVWPRSAGAAANLPAGFTDYGQVCHISLTSGSTGQAKQVSHTVAGTGRRVFEKYLGGIDTCERSVLCMPGLSSNYGFTTSCATLVAGRTLCFSISPYQAIRMIELYAIDFAMMSTEQLLAVTRVAKKSAARLRSLRTIWFGGSAPTRALLGSRRHLSLQEHQLPLWRIRSRTHWPCHDPRNAGHSRLRGPCRARHRGCDLRRRRTGCRSVTSARSEFGTIKPMDYSRALWLDQRRGSISAIAAGSMPMDAFSLSIAWRISTCDRRTKRQPAPYISGSPEIEHLLRLEWDMADAAAVTGPAASPGAPLQIWIGIVGNEGARVDALEALLRARGLDCALTVVELKAIPRGLRTARSTRTQLKAAISGRHGRRRSAVKPSLLLRVRRQAGRWLTMAARCRPAPSAQQQIRIHRRG